LEDVKAERTIEKGELHERSHIRSSFETCLHPEYPASASCGTVRICSAAPGFLCVAPSVRSLTHNIYEYAVRYALRHPAPAEQFRAGYLLVLFARICRTCGGRRSSPFPSFYNKSVRRRYHTGREPSGIRNTLRRIRSFRPCTGNSGRHHSNLDSCIRFTKK